MLALFALFFKGKKPPTPQFLGFGQRGLVVVVNMVVTAS